jgi:hypothetical protein
MGVISLRQIEHRVGLKKNDSRPFGVSFSSPNRRCTTIQLKRHVLESHRHFQHPAL